MDRGIGSSLSAFNRPMRFALRAAVLACAMLASMSVILFLRSYWYMSSLNVEPGILPANTAITGLCYTSRGMVRVIVYTETFEEQFAEHWTQAVQHRPLWAVYEDGPAQISLETLYIDQRMWGWSKCGFIYESTQAEQGCFGWPPTRCRFRAIEIVAPMPLFTGIVSAPPAIVLIRRWWRRRPSRGFEVQLS